LHVSRKDSVYRHRLFGTSSDIGFFPEKRIGEPLANQQPAAQFSDQHPLIDATIRDRSAVT
jgi:hypothetical protein